MKPTGNFSLPRSSGEMGKLVTAFDWSTTSLGEPSTWPRSLSAVVSMVLSGGFPAIVLWGADLLQIYNDGYCKLMGRKHPSGLGQPTRDCWPEVWHINEPIYERVRQGETITLENALFPITRHGACARLRRACGLGNEADRCCQPEEAACSQRETVTKR